MYKSTLLKAFCLEGLLLDKLSAEIDCVRLFVRSPRTRARCPRCNTSSSRVHKRTVRKILHGRINDQPTYLILLVRNFWCKPCAKSFRESFPGIDRRQTTGRYRAMVLPKAKNRSFSDVAREYNCSASGLVRSIRATATTVGICWPTEPFAMGVDEHSFAGRDLMLTITDVTHNRLLAILPDDQQATLRSFVQNMPEYVKKLIYATCIDMKQSYLTVLTEELPQAPLVVDKFHVIQHLNWHLNQIRQIYTNHTLPLPKMLLEKNKEDLSTEEMQKLKNIFKHYPAIEELWRLKEWMRQWYRTSNEYNAKQRYAVMLDGLRKDQRPRWQMLLRTLNKWQPYLLNYFTHRVTNAFTEGAHTKIKLLKRISYGFRNKTNYIAKMTLAFLPIITLLEVLRHHPV